MIRVLILFLFFSLHLHSQNYKIDDNLPLYNQGVIFRDSLAIFSSNQIFMYPLERESHPIVRTIYNEILNQDSEESSSQMHQYVPVVSNEELYFIQHKGGLVFKYQNDSIVRVDRSFTHRMQIGSNVFNYNNTIYRFGGYGFWSFRNFFTFFSEEVHEWEALSPVNTTVSPPGISNGLFAHSNDSFVTFNGRIRNPHDLTNTSDSSNEVWSYDFKLNRWENLGRLEYDLSNMKGVAQLEDELLISSSGSFLTRIEPFKNRVRNYKLTSLQYKLFSSNGRLGIYKNGNKYYSFVKFDNVNTVELIERNDDEFFGELIEETKLYQDLSPWRYMLLILVLPILYYVRKFYLLSKERNSKVIIKSEGLIYHKVFFEFEPKELEVINLLLDFDTVHSSDILVLVENPNHNYSHNMRTKNQLIDKINYKFKTMLKIDYDLITSEKSAEDKRIIDYKIDKSFFN